jgi:hypothetical protein
MALGRRAFCADLPGLPARSPLWIYLGRRLHGDRQPHHPIPWRVARHLDPATQGRSAGLSPRQCAYPCHGRALTLARVAPAQPAGQLAGCAGVCGASGGGGFGGMDFRTEEYFLNCFLSAQPALVFALRPKRKAKVVFVFPHRLRRGRADQRISGDVAGGAVVGDVVAAPQNQQARPLAKHPLLPDLRGRSLPDHLDATEYCAGRRGIGAARDSLGPSCPGRLGGLVLFMEGLGAGKSVRYLSAMEQRRHVAGLGSRSAVAGGGGSLLALPHELGTARFVCIGLHRDHAFPGDGIPRHVFPQLLPRGRSLAIPRVAGKRGPARVWRGVALRALSSQPES